MRGLGALVGAAGWWLPWVLHPSGAAALVLLGLDLGEFFKFTDAGRAGQLEWERQLFYLPPVLASLALAALAAERRFLGRLLLASTASLLAIVVLPPYPYDRSRLLSAEFRFQTLSALIAFACAAIALLAPLFGRPPRALLRTLQAAIGIAGAGLPLWAFWRVRLLLDGLYGRPIVVGPGLYLTAAGFALLSIAAAVALWRQRRRPAVVRPATGP